MCEAVKSHLAQAFFVSFHYQLSHGIVQFFVILIIFNEEAVCDHILSTVQKDAFRRFSVTSCPSCLLIITFHVFRHIVVDDVADIRLVDSHPKGICRHHDRTSVIDKIILVDASFFIRKPGMITCRAKSIPDQFPTDFLHQFSGQAVDDPALVRVLFYVILHFCVFIFR